MSRVGVREMEKGGAEGGADKEAFEDKMGGERRGWCIFRPRRKVVCFLPPLYPGSGGNIRDMALAA